MRQIASGIHFGNRVIFIILLVCRTLCANTCRNNICDVTLDVSVIEGHIRKILKQFLICLTTDNLTSLPI